VRYWFLKYANRMKEGYKMDETKKMTQKKDETKKEKKKTRREKDTIISRLLVELGGDASRSSMALKLYRDLKASTDLAPRREVNHIVNLYYQIQNFRMATASQRTKLLKYGEPSMLPEFLSDNFEYLEDAIKRTMGSFASQYTIGKWLQSICGIGPIMSAGFLVTFDIRDQPTAGCWHSYAGLVPGVKWTKGEFRPWDARAKVLCYKAGESFVNQQNNKNDFYGKIFAKRRVYEDERNERGELAEQAAEKLKRTKIGKDKKAYEIYSSGKLPPAHLHSRARRYTVKLFLSHLHDVSWRDYYDIDPPVPYVFSTKYEGGVHRHFIEPPQCDLRGISLKELWVEDEEYEEKKKRREKRREEKRKKEAGL